MITWAPILLQAAIAIFLVCGIAAILVLWRGCSVLRRMARSTVRDDVPILLKSPRVPGVSVVALARGASTKTLGFIRRLLDLTFGNQELVVVLSSPSEQDLAAWMREFQLVPSPRSTEGELPVSSAVKAAYESTLPLSMLVLVKDQSDDSDGWNTAVNCASYPVIAVYDPESEFLTDSLLRLIRPMLDEPELVFAVYGTAPAPPAPGLSGRFAEIEATQMWLGRCAAFAVRPNTLAPTPGSAMLIRRDAIISAGGFTSGPFELFLHLQGRARRSGKAYRAEFVAEPVSYLPATQSLAELRERITDDQRMVLRAVRHHKSIMGGRFALGWTLPAIRFYRFWLPLLETVSYLFAIAAVAMGLIDRNLFVLVLLTTVGAGMLISMTAVVLREIADFRGSDPSRLIRLFWASIPENLGYRQLRNLWLIGAQFTR